MNSLLAWHARNLPLVLVLLAALAVFAGYALVRSWPQLFPDTVTTVAADPACNLRAGPCITRLPGGASVRFAIEPRTLPALEPLQLSVNLDGIAARKVEVDFSGTDMFMGFNRVVLQQQSAGKYTGQGTLSVCTRAVMEWRASVLIETGEGTLAVPYRFIVIKPEAG